jgi:CRISPR-associated protein Csm3
MSQLKATLTIHGKIECLTGLHIGGSGNGYQIGSIENSVVRNPIDDFPFIPGSSLKGKLRSLMEWAMGKIAPNGKVYSSEHSNKPDDDEVLRIFGAPAGAEWKAGPARLIVRDALPDRKTRVMMHDLELNQGLPKVEVKTEVNLNRITAKPLSIARQIERVPVGSFFDFELVFLIYEISGLKVKDIDLLDKVFFVLRLLEDSALGGSGSRGSGQVRFHLGEPVIKTVRDYQSGSTPAKTPGSESAINNFKTLDHFSEDVVNKLKERLRQQIEVKTTAETQRTERPEKPEEPVEKESEEQSP